ncbi:MAG: zf-HC2 domain-containing protein [Gemmatimonadota bacterium]
MRESQADMDREIAGMRCRDVLARLTDYVDDDLELETAERMRAHVSACDVCEQFGGVFAELVVRLKGTLPEAAPLPPAVRARLVAQLSNRGVIPPGPAR